MALVTTEEDLGLAHKPTDLPHCAQRDRDSAPWTETEEETGM